jgi:hypothetical protein
VKIQSEKQLASCDVQRHPPPAENIPGDRDHRSRHPDHLSDDYDQLIGIILE